MEFLDDTTIPCLNGLWGDIAKFKLIKITKIFDLLAYFSHKVA